MRVARVWTTDRSAVAERGVRAVDAEIVHQLCPSDLDLAVFAVV